eukprot:CAMPEP_0176471756 /NCGR_PEP_ID=MMETSP0127-20121128/41330_1 /TAXON_ID=938130 /ORGANISM="Platyophrya macrostoma, Strain WH" /LENGTH=211 /DNA_ID=CAMNT_0017866481 /DNA_START=108 /DNA_END=743 /DNA_ORIENTATION=-
MAVKNLNIQPQDDALKLPPLFRFSSNQSYLQQNGQTPSSSSHAFNAGHFEYQLFLNTPKRGQQNAMRINTEGDGNSTPRRYFPVINNQNTFNNHIQSRGEPTLFQYRSKISLNNIGRQILPALPVHMTDRALYMSKSLEDSQLTESDASFEEDEFFTRSILKKADKQRYPFNDFQNITGSSLYQSSNNSSTPTASSKKSKRVKFVTEIESD